MDFGTTEFKRKVLNRVDKFGEIIGLVNNLYLGDESIKLRYYIYKNENDKDVLNFVSKIIRCEILIKLLDDYFKDFYYYNRKHTKELIMNNILLDFASNNNKTFENFVKEIVVGDEWNKITIENFNNFLQNKCIYKFNDDLPHFIIRHIFYSIIEIEKFEDLTSFLNKEENCELKNEIVKFKIYITLLDHFGLYEIPKFKKLDKIIKRKIIFKFGKDYYKDFKTYCDNKESEDEEEEEEKIENLGL